ncbi:MAG: DUF1015 domain-containing protein, partial [Clostridia bacterium]|nr:DUF1015 domain-containing protein [Clostridia bacterium]
MYTFKTPGLAAAEILLPHPGTDMQKWATVACDQYTSQPGYWAKVEAFVGSAPSTYNLMLPECFLNAADMPLRERSILRHMQQYLEDGALRPCGAGAVYLRRTVPQGIREGLVLAVDLEKYDYKEGALPLIRASEGTIVDRLPPRVRVRRAASLEAPHI